MLTRKHKFLILGIVAAAVAIASIATLSKPAPSYDARTTGVAMMAPAPEFAARDMALGAPSAIVADEGFVPPFLPPSAGKTAAEVDQKVIKNGYLRMVVDRVSETAAQIASMAERRGGFVQNSSVTERGDGAYSGEVTVRVPAKEFETAMAEIKSYAKVVKNETRSGQDVTEQYTDLQAQLRNAKAQEETYLQILKRAQTVEDILKVQERLGGIRSVIESLQGRIQYLENVTSYSTITISLEEEPAVRVPTKEFRPLSSVKAAFQTLVAALQGFVVAVIWIVIVLGGVLAPAWLIVWAVRKLWRRLRGKK